MSKAFTLAFVLLLILAAAAAAQTPPQHSATLTWADQYNPAGTTYTVYRATGLCSGTPVMSKLATALTVRTYEDTTVTPGNFCYQVTASFSGVESGPGNSASASVPTFSPTNLSVQVK